MFDLPFRGSEAVARGLTTPGRLRGPRFVRLFPDVYVAARVEADLRIRSLAAAQLVRPGGGLVACWSAAELLGAACAPADAPAEVLVEGHVRAHPGLRVRRGTAVGDEVWTVRGVRVTSPLRTAWDLARREALVDAVVALDALAARGCFAPSALLDRRSARPRVPGCRRLDRVVALADPRAESAMETRLRLLLVLAGLPAPRVQYRLRDATGLVVARFDLAYPECLLAIEYDGRAHVDELDRGRDVRTGQLGWYTARFTRYDLGRPAETADAVRTLRERRAGLGHRDVTVPGT